MELSQLKYFKTVAETGKISDAAQALFISAPALSTAISRLERELGMKLFDRTNNRIVLNRQGEIFLRYVNQVMSTLDCAKSELQQSLLFQGHHVSVASIASTQLVDMVTAFTQEHPQITLLCSSVNREKLLQEGLSAHVGFLLAAEAEVPRSYAEKLDNIFLFEDHPVVMVHKDHSLAKQSSVDLRQLQRENVFMPLQDYPLYHNLTQIFRQCDIPVPAGNAYSHLATQQMVAKGLGVAFASSRMALTVSQSVRYVPISDTYTPWVTRLYWRKNQSFTPDELLFKTFVEQYYAKEFCIK